MAMMGGSSAAVVGAPLERLPISLRFAAGFLALASPDTVVFGCTLQRAKLKSKIKADAESICTQGTPRGAHLLLRLVPCAHSRPSRGSSLRP
jgi:hypothetical protein